MKYGKHERQRIWVHPNASQGGTWAIVIHGGIWRDPNITEESGVKLAEQFSTLFDGVATIDYRLSPEVVHPEHRNDCIKAVETIVHQYSPTKLVLIGHSAGAFIAGQIAPSFKQTVLIVCLEGLYDLIDLCEEYPSYAEYIEDAFGPDRSVWKEAEPQWSQLPLILLHSEEDELVSLRQPKLCLSLNPSAELVVIDKGKHDQVFEHLNLVLYLGEKIQQKI